MKKALITGGSKGIGLGAVQRFVKLGYAVITCSRNKELWKSAVSQFPELETVEHISCDISNEADVAKLFEHIQAKYGSLDIAVNNASPKLESTGKFESVESDHLKHTLLTDFWSHAMCMRRELKLLNQGGCIVNISSVNGLRPTPNAAMYSASKHALESLTRSVALEAVERGIRVNSVAPGVTWTPRWEQRVAEGHSSLREDVEAVVPMGRFAKVSEVIDAVEWLTSAKASYIVGQAIVVDGGLSLK